MPVATRQTAFVETGVATLGLSQMFSVTPSSSNPTYVVLSVLDRDEYTAAATGATGTLSGNGQTANLTSMEEDARGVGIIFAYQPTTGRYYSSTYGYLDALTYTSSPSLNDVTSLSLFGTNNARLAQQYGGDPYNLMQVDPGGY